MLQGALYFKTCSRHLHLMGSGINVAWRGGDGDS